MKITISKLILFSYFLIHSLTAQTGYQFVTKDIFKSKVNFRLISNMIVIPVNLNGSELNFIIDTGVSSTLLFNTTNIDSLDLKHIKKRTIKGLGSSKSVATAHSHSNVLKIGEIINRSQSLEIILDKQINFSGRLGIPIHGILGCDLFNNFIVDVNYSKERLTFYSLSSYPYKKLKRHDKIDLQVYRKKLYVKSEIQLTDTFIAVKMLLDTGSGDTLWVFEDQKEGIAVPERYFDDYMGRGIGGDIFGKRSRLNSLKIGDYKVNEALVSFPDSSAIALVKNQNNRNGSICSNLLRRFNLVINVAEREMYIKKNRFFSEPFEYNMSGIEVEHNGSKVISVFDPKINLSKTNAEDYESSKVFSVNKFYKLALVPVYKVVQVRDNSPAKEAGIRIGDSLISINNKSLTKKNIDKILELLSLKDGKKITVVVDRNGLELKFRFRLKKRI